MKKVFRKLHLWLSVPFGLFITLICFSGSMLIFEKEITEMCRRDLYYVSEVHEHTLPVDSLMRAVASTLPDTVEVTGVTVPSEADRTWQVSLSKPRRASVYVDPYTGEVKGRSERLPFYDTMFHLHRWMMGSSKGAGKLLVGVSTLMLVVILLTGILMWLTNRKKPLARSLTISFTKGWPRFWHDLHVAGGIYATIVLLALALTGLTWSFPWYRTAFYAAFGVEASAEGHGGGRPAGDGSAPEGKSREHRGGGDRRGGHRGEGDSTAVRRESHEETAEAAHSRGTAEPEKRKEVRKHARKERNEAPADSTVREAGESAGTMTGDEEETVRETRGEEHGRRGHRGGRHRHDGDSLGIADTVGRGGRHRPTGSDGQPAMEMADRQRREERQDARGGQPSDRPQRKGGKYSGNHTADRMTADTAAVELAGNGVPADTLKREEAVPMPLFAHWQTVLDRLKASCPDFRQITLSDGSAGLVPAGRNSLRAADRYSFDPESGEITGCRPYAEGEKAAKVRSGVYTVHVGSWGGMLTRVITFLAALLGATLPLTGYYLWIRRLVKKRGKRDKSKE